jgi:hypothetical protein
VADGDEALADDLDAPRARRRGPFRAAPPDDPRPAQVVCPFLAREDAEGAFQPATGNDRRNRCTAIGEPIPQASRQQQLVCLAAAHANCPRYLRGVLVSETSPPASRKEPVSRAIVGASLILAASLAASFGFLAVRGGFALTMPSASPPGVALATASPAPSATPGASTVPPSSAPTTAPSATPAPTPEPTAPPAPTATPVPTASPTARPTVQPTPVPTSDRFKLLTACPSTPDCWIYVIRSGDNLRSIANYFGVNYNRMLAMNPSLRIPIHPGDRLRIPTPTR